MLYETQFLLALLLTVTVEATTIGMAVRFIPAIRAAELPVSNLIGAGIIPSLATLPYFWFVLPAYLPAYLPRVVIGETGIVIIETILILLITRLPLRYSALLSLLANGVSIVAGLVVFR